MKIVQSILTNNDCYKAGRKITVKGLMLHSVGCSQPDASVFVKNWNKSGLEVCVHAFIDGNTGDIHQTLPWNHRGWHGGGSSNNTHIGVEMCEPACIKYTSGANFTCSNLPVAREVTKRTYNAAVELFAYLCKEFNLDPLEDGVIISHAEGYKRGIASGHADPEHLWNQLGMGYTMNTFREAVRAAMGGKIEGDNNTPDVLYCVQVGAFSNPDNARNLLAKIKEAGFDGFITTKTVATAEPKPVEPVKQLKEGCLVRVKKGAKTYTGGSLASFVYERDHTVKEISGNRVVITFTGVVVAAVHKDDLTVL